jgi:Fe-S cluster biosynthesis and repair protein YggX
LGKFNLLNRSPTNKRRKKITTIINDDDSEEESASTRDVLIEEINEFLEEVDEVNGSGSDGPTSGATNVKPVSHNGEQVQHPNQQ